MPRFIHDFGDGLSFETVQVETSEEPIRVKSMDARVIRLKTSKSVITGSYKVRDTLTLTTSNAAVDATVQARNSNWHTPSNINIETSNGRIQASISLLSSFGDGEPAVGGLKVKTVTNHGRISIDIPTTPVGSHLQLEARTSNADTWVGLPSTFEGSVAVQNTVDRLGYTSVVNHVTQDPTGGGLQRTFMIDKISNTQTEGRVWWGPEKDHRELGYAWVKTSNAKNVMELN